jgi:hypothetical protein
MTAAVELHVVEGEIVEAGNGVRLDNLYRLIDVDRAAGEAYQRLTMPAAFDVLAAWESDEWRRDKRAERQAYIDEHGVQPLWSAESSRTFTAWVQERAERDGHPTRSRTMIENLRDAAICVRLVRGVIEQRGHSVAMPTTEEAWRPARKLLTQGYREQIADTVERAGELAEAKGEPIAYTHMLAARKEVERADPLIRARESAPLIDNRTRRDKSITLLHKAQTAVGALLDKGNRAEIEAFRAWFEAQS